LHFTDSLAHSSDLDAVGATVDINAPCQSDTYNYEMFFEAEQVYNEI
jgi:hypothetical protein